MDETDYRYGWDGTTACHLAVTQASFGTRQVQSLPHPPKCAGVQTSAAGARLDGHRPFKAD